MFDRTHSLPRKSLRMAGLVMLALAMPLSAQPQPDAAAGARAPKRMRQDKHRVPLLTNPQTHLDAWKPQAVMEWDRFDATFALQEDAAAIGKPYRIGFHRPSPVGVLSPRTHGTWTNLRGQGRIWTLELRSPGAKGLRVHFSRFEIPPDASLTVTDAYSSETFTYRENGPYNNPGFWTGDLFGETAYLEYRDADIPQRAPTIEIDEISHFYRELPGLIPVGGVELGGLLPCHEDPNCHGVNLNARDAVGQMTFSDGGTVVCSGALLNDLDPNTFYGYFLTANHCIDSQPVANTLVVRWFYQSTICNGSVNSGVTIGGGGTLLATGALSTSSDFTLLRLSNDPEHGQGLAAWNSSAVSNGGVPVTSIHHPDGSWKRYSQGFTVASAPICSGLALARFIYNDWTLDTDGNTIGVLEGGSSGGPMFNANWEVIGQAYGMCLIAQPACNNPQSYNNVYGRFSLTYPSVSSYLTAITPDDAHENNDTLATAAPLGAGTHNLILVDYDDYFRVSVCGNTILSATATFSGCTSNCGAGQMDLDMELLTSSGMVLDNSLGNGSSENVSAVLGTGEYIVRNIKDRFWGGNYTLAIVLDPTNDCNNNNLDDACEIADGASPDCNLNGLPDECDSITDCNNNQIHDVCDVNQGITPDCNINGIPDSCESVTCSAQVVLAGVNSGGTASSASFLRGTTVYEVAASTSQRGGVGFLSSEDYALGDGFWHAEAPCSTRLYGDIAPPPNGDGFVELADVLCSLAGYGEMSLCSLGDIAPCQGDDLIELADILAILNAYASNALCPNPCY